MKGSFSRVAAAVFVLVSGGAKAVPIHLDFSGTISGGTLDTPFGAPISGGFSFETDRLLSSGGPYGCCQYTFTDWNPAGLTQPLATVTFDGRDISYPLYGQTYAYINFLDACQPECDRGGGENFSLNVISEDPWTPNYTGVRRSQLLSVMSLSQSPLPDFPFWQPFNYFDGAAMTPEDTVTLPLHRLVGIFHETVSECVAGSCTNVSDSQFNFSIDNVSRGVGASSVPEPGTLGLLGAGLLAAHWMRRRRKPELAPRRQRA